MANVVLTDKDENGDYTIIYHGKGSMKMNEEELFEMLIQRQRDNVIKQKRLLESAFEDLPDEIKSIVLDDAEVTVVEVADNGDGTFTTQTDNYVEHLLDVDSAVMCPQESPQVDGDGASPLQAVYEYFMGQTRMLTAEMGEEDKNFEDLLREEKAKERAGWGGLEPEEVSEKIKAYFENSDNKIINNEGMGVITIRNGEDDQGQEHMERKAQKDSVATQEIVAKINKYYAENEETPTLSTEDGFSQIQGDPAPYTKPLWIEELKKRDALWCINMGSSILNDLTSWGWENILKTDVERRRSFTDMKTDIEWDVFFLPKAYRYERNSVDAKRTMQIDYVFKNVFIADDHSNFGDASLILQAQIEIITYDEWLKDAPYSPADIASRLMDMDDIYCKLVESEVYEEANKDLPCSNGDSIDFTDGTWLFDPSNSNDRELLQEGWVNTNVKDSYATEFCDDSTGSVWTVHILGNVTENSDWAGPSYKVGRHSQVILVNRALDDSLQANALLLAQLSIIQDEGRVNDFNPRHICDRLLDMSNIYSKLIG